MTQPLTTSAETATTRSAWVLAGVLPDAAPQPEPTANDEPFNPLAGLETEA